MPIPGGMGHLDVSDSRVTAKSVRCTLIRIQIPLGVRQTEMEQQSDLKGGDRSQGKSRREHYRQGEGWKGVGTRA